MKPQASQREPQPLVVKFKTLQPMTLDAHGPLGLDFNIGGVAGATQWLGLARWCHC